MSSHIEQRALSEAQNATFDTEYHSPAEFAAKLAVLKRHFGTRPVRMLDAGGGNGSFTDAVLEEFPNWTSTVIDVSRHLLAQNTVSERKTLLEGSIFDLRTLVPGCQFDLICINWMLHHLVGRTYQESRRNIVSALQVCCSALNDGGLLCVGENRYQGIGDTNISSWLIYRLTSIEMPAIARLVGKYANTAGVGVCFQAESGWLELFSTSGLEERYPSFRYRPFQIRELIKHALMLKSAGKIHYYLAPTRC